MKNFVDLCIHNLKKYLRQKTNSLFALTFILSIFFSGLHAINASLDPRNYRTGAKPLSEKQIKHIEKNWPRILGVRPNKYGAARIQKQLRERGVNLSGIEIAKNQNEFITNKNSDSKALNTHKSIMSAIMLPSQVDNSKLSCFPAIGNQAQQGSCVGWASTYYHATHEYGLLNGINNKTNTSGVRSPKWTYNMINSGEDYGSYPDDAYALLNTNGAPGFNEFPYDTNYREWDLKTQDWISALSYRMGEPLFITIKDSNDINTVKEILNNGHLVTFVTFANSWQFTKVSADPSQESNPYAGQAAISWMNGQLGGHHTTIVGYDDNVWIDVNGNGKVDAGEKGAFLIANSWGTGWANGGFVWISYDAFLKNSAVTNGPSANRQQVAQMLFSITPKSSKYSPKAVAKFSLSQTVRKELKISLGVSNTDATTPSSKFVSGALTQDGGSYAFNGQSPQLQTATFALDLTDLLPATNIVQKYYLILEDTSYGNQTTLNSYSIVDLINNKEVSFSGTPLTCDRSVIQPNIVFQQSQDPDPQPQKISVTITNPTNLSVVKDTISVTAATNEGVNVTKIEFYVDSQLSGVDLSSPFMLSLDTTKLSNGIHTLTAKAYDDAGNTANHSIEINVQNSGTTDFPSYLSYQQSKIFGWNTGAQYRCTLKNQGTKTIKDLKIKILAPPTNIYLWNVSILATDSQGVTVGLPSWQRSLRPGESLSFGYIVYPDKEPQVSFISATQR